MESQVTLNSPLSVPSASTPFTVSGSVGTVPETVAVEILRIAITSAITCSLQVTLIGSMPSNERVPFTV